MAGATTNYGYAFFDFGDVLDSRINAQLEVDRFVLIDEQMFGLYSIFGNGVITGWIPTNTNSDLSVTISPGVAIINSLACETDFPIDVSNLPANDTVVIYAYTSGTTPVNRTTQFGYTSTSIPTGSIPLANVTTGDTAVTSIDTTIMQTIGFQQIIAYEVAHHHHTGSPPKIQLDTETQGLLPGARIAPLDASAFQSGKISIAQVSQINHNQLQNIGLLTHAQLDTLIGSIQRDTEQLLGEISSVNLMKAIVFQKYKDTLVDEFFINELAIIPGISPSNIIDWENTTANVDTVNQCISGLPPEFLLPGLGGTGQTEADLSIVVIKWQTDADFNKASVINNLTINNGVYLLSDSIQNLVLDDFETVTTGNADGYTGSLSETTSISSTYDNSTASQGFYSGKFETKHTFFSTFKKTYNTPQNWSSYNELVLSVKSYSASHAAVYMKIADSSGNVITTLTLLATDEITSVGNLQTSGFAIKTFDLTNLNVSSIGSITIYTDNISTSDEVFWLDNIYLQNNNLLLPQGTLRLRYSASTPVIFRSIDYTASIPVGTDFRVRERVGMDIQSMLTAPFSTRLSAGDVFSTVGREIEIDITFYSDTTDTKTPLLSYIELQILVQSEDSGFTINDANSFSRGTFNNEQVITEADGVTSYVRMQYTNVGDTYFLYEGIVNELDPSNVPQFGVNGSNVPISPLQAYNNITGQQSSGFYNATSVYRMPNANFLVADTDNDRVIETTPNGAFVRGFGCHNRDYDITPYALTVLYNPVIGKMYITFSMQVVLETFDYTQINLNWNASTLTLDNSSDLRENLVGTTLTYDPNASNITLDRIIVIDVSTNHQTLLSTANTQIYAQLNTDPNLNYIPVFVGNFLYYGRGAILRPVYANQIEAGKWLIGSSKIFYGYDDITSGTFLEASPSGVTSNQTNLSGENSTQAEFSQMVNASQSILSIIDDTSVAQTSQSFGTFDFEYNGVAFSEITLGGIYPISSRQILIAGLRILPIPAAEVSAGNDPSPGAAAINARGSDTNRLSRYQGIVIVLDKPTQRILFTYQSPEGMFPSDAFVDDNGFYVISETSLIPQAGRIIRLDRFGNIADVISNGMYTKINDIRKLANNHMLVST